MKFIVIIFLLKSLTGWSQSRLTAMVSICSECRGVATMASDKEIGKKSVKTSRTKKGELRPETIYAPYKIIQDGREIASGRTNSNGIFEIDLEYGTYQIQVNVNQFLHADTTIELRGRRQRINIELDDKLLRKYIDSIGTIKYPYNKETAKRDIENGEVWILTAGLQMIPGNDLDSVTLKYRFKYYPVAGCLVDSYQLKAMENYNAVVYEYLDKVNGQGWQEKLNSDIMALYQTYFKKKGR